MARFCTHCGNSIANEGAKFCAKCGTTLPAQAATTEAAAPPAQAPPPTAAQPVASAPVPPAAPAAQSSGPWVKIIVAVVGFFVLIGVLAIGTCAYVGYRVKKRVEQAKSEYGLDKLARSSSSSSSSSTVQERDVCSLLSKEEVSEITGATITEAHGTTSQCTYASATNPTVVQDNVSWQGGAMAFKLAVMSMKMSAGGQAIVNLPEIGDEACTIGLEGKTKEDLQREAKNDQSGMLKGMTNLLGRSPLMFHKGDVMVSLGVSEARDIDEAKKTIATKIASRL